MVKYIHTVVAPCGSTLKRTSQTRQYTHMVALKYSLTKALATPFHYYPTEKILLEEGARLVKRLVEGDERSKEFTRTRLDGATTPEEYVDNYVKRYFAEVEGRRLEGYYDRYWGYSWHGKLPLAERVVRDSKKRDWYEDVAIFVPTMVTK
jgi:hypothetical protein